MTTALAQLTNSKAPETGLNANTSPVASKVIEMRSRELSHAASVTGAFTYYGENLEAVNAPQISIDVLYQGREAGSKQFVRAVELLGCASESLSEARTAFEDGDRVGYASEVSRFEQLLQPLFECRGIGDGFANVINTIHFAIANLKGEPLSYAQITTLWRIIREVAEGPFLNFKDSLEIVRALEKVGLGLNNSFLSQWASE